MNNKIDNFYKAFEDKYRGSNEVIKNRLSIYLPYVKTINKIYTEMRCLDLGCGRGEWIELLNDHSINAYGVDLNPQMIHAYKNTNKVIVGDVITHLKSLPNESLELITGFHIAEHLKFEDLYTLIEESFRVLKSSGLLILETPNTENLTVGTSGFYIDPTHIRPIPMLQLNFLTEHIGFYRSQILRLQQWEALSDKTTPISFYQVLNGVSPDYAIISQKKGSSTNMKSFDELFSIKHGISLEEIADRQFLQQHDLYNTLKFRLIELEAINRSHDNFINSYSASIKVINFLTFPITKVFKSIKKLITSE